MNDNFAYEAAALKGRAVWLQELLRELLPQLNQPSTNYRDWFDSVIKIMEGRGLILPTQQKDYLSDIRNAIKVLDPEHKALEVVNFDTQTWIQINNRSSDKLGQRTTKFIDNPDAIVKRATTLLGSYQWSEIAAGLAVITGRRSTEVIKTAQFEYKSSYSVYFTGSLKRGDEPVECVFEIPTLCEAKLVIDAIANLRAMLGEKIQDLSKRQVSRRYGKAVATKCDFYFDELVPIREGKDNLYTHLFRAVYATIASFWYCPPTVPEIEFRAAIQGHYQIIDEQDPKLRRSIAAERNYFDYRISDGRGNVDGRLGIKLNLPDVKILEEFQHQANSFEHEQKKKKYLRKKYTPSEHEDRQIIDSEDDHKGCLHAQADTKSTESNNQNFLTKQSNSKTMNQSFNSAQTNPTVIPSFFQSRLSTIADKLGITPEQTIQALFTWTEMGLSLAEQLEVKELTPQAIFESVEQLQVSAQKKSSISNLDSETNLDSQTFNQLATSIRLLSEALHAKQKNQSSQPVVSDSAITTNLERVNTTDNHSGQSNSSNSTIQIPKDHRQSESTSDKSSNKKSSSRKISKKSIEAEKEVSQAINAIMEFNDQENLDHKDKWHIGLSALRKITQRGDSVINRVLEKSESQIEQHHAQHRIGAKHNSKGKDYPSIDEIIKL